jgi:hypothetical protein
MTDKGFAPEEIDTTTPHPARMYDYYLGGKDNYEADRRAAQRLVDAVPDVVPTALENRGFMRRAVRHVAEQGIRQFIDIGTGIPTSPNTHEIAQGIAPGTRVAYVDNDPIVSTHAGAKLAVSRDTGFVRADVRDPRSVLDHPVVRELVDFGRPVALMLVAVLHFVRDDEDPYGIVATLRDALAPGSFLVLSHVSADFHGGSPLPEVQEAYRRATATMNERRKDGIERFFEGFSMVEPGLVQVPLWKPDGPLPDAAELRRVACYGGVGLKS